MPRSVNEYEAIKKSNIAHKGWLTQQRKSLHNLKILNKGLGNQQLCEELNAKYKKYYERVEKMNDLYAEMIEIDPEREEEVDKARNAINDDFSAIQGEIAEAQEQHRRSRAPKTPAVIAAPVLGGGGTSNSREWRRS